MVCQAVLTLFWVSSSTWPKWSGCLVSPLKWVTNSNQKISQRAFWGWSWWWWWGRKWWWRRIDSRWFPNNWKGDCWFQDFTTCKAGPDPKHRCWFQELEEHPDFAAGSVGYKWFRLFDVLGISCVQGQHELVPRLDRWLASEPIKGLKGVPDLQFKVQGYIERCTRDGTAPRGRAVLHMSLVTLTWIASLGRWLLLSPFFK